MYILKKIFDRVFKKLEKIVTHATTIFELIMHYSVYEI